MYQNFTERILRRKKQIEFYKIVGKESTEATTAYFDK